MTAKDDSFRKFLGVSADADAYRLLALTPGQRHPTAIQRGLEAQLARVNRHIHANSAEAAAVRERLREAADSLRRGNPLMSSAPATAPLPYGRGSDPLLRSSASPPWRPNQHGFQLTSFDRTVLAMLVAYGGWNSVSRAKLVAMAAMHNVSPQGLMKVINGLSNYARRGEHHFDVREITQGANRFEAPPVPPSEDAEPEPPELRWQDHLMPEIKGGGAWATIKLSLLFGTITLLLGVLFVRMLLRDPGTTVTPPPRPTIVSQAPASPSTPIISPGDTTSGDIAERPPLLAFTTYPTSRGDASPSAAEDAADQSPRLPERFDQLARKLTVSETPSAATLQDWSVYNEQAGLAWPLINDAILTSVRIKFLEALSASADRPSVTADLLRIVEEAAGRVRDPLDIWRGAWAAGMLGELVGRSDIPPVVREQARKALERNITNERLAQVSDFTTAARAWLDQSANDLIERMMISESDAASAWELWIRAQVELGRDRHFERSVLDALESLLRSTRDIGAPGPAANVSGRLLTLLDFEDSVAVRERILGWLDDPEIGGRDRWALTSMLAISAAVPWFSEELVIIFDAPADARRRIAGLISERWPEIEPARWAEQGRPIAVNARLGARWRALAEQHIVATREITIEHIPQALLAEVVQGSWLNEAAAALARDDVAAAQDAIERFEKGWQWTPVASAGWSRPGRLQPPALPANPQPRGGGRGGQPRPTGNSVPLAPGAGAAPGGGNTGIFLYREADGEWAAAYEAARRSTQERLDLLRALRMSAKDDLGPIDAAVLVGEAYRSPTPEVRDFAQAVVLELFTRGTNVAVELLDQFIDAPTREATSSFVETATGQLLPSVRTAEWRAEARLALLNHVLSLLPSSAEEVDDLAAAYGESLVRRLQFLRPELAQTAASGAPQAAMEMLVNAWRSSVSSLVVTAPTELSLGEIERRHNTRLQLARGGIDRTVAGQITLLELLAFTVTAEQPSASADVASILADTAVRRHEAAHVLQQASMNEAAALRVWLKRLDVSAQAAQGVPWSEQNDAQRRGAKAARSRSGAINDKPRSAAQSVAFASSHCRATALRPRHPRVSLSYIFVAALGFSGGHSPPYEDRWSERLEALRPSNPEAYFLLAEEMADAAENDDRLALARYLFRLAAVLDPSRFGRSAGLALADLETDEKEKRRLLALAALLDQRVREPNWLPAPEESSIDRMGALVLSQALSVYRRGYGSRARNILEQSESATQLLGEFGDAIGGERRIRENMDRYRTGELSPVKTERELVELLRFERALLAGDERTWSGEILLYRGRSLIEVDPSNLAQSFEVDPTRPYYRNGRWVADPRE